jgi:dolichol-phosphate mannosyltransferase
MRLSFLLSVVVPVYNEEAVLHTLDRRLSAVLDETGQPYEVIFVNDGSSDNSLPILERLAQSNPRYRIINFSRNFGHQLAVTAGLDYVSGDAVVIIDADLQDPPELIHQLVAKWQEGFEVVYAIRQARSGESLYKRATASIFYRLLRTLTNIDLPLDTGDFRLMDRKAVEQLKSLRETHRFVRGMVSWIGFSQTGITYTRDPRAHGSTKYSTRKMVRLALDAIMSFSAFPLQLASLFGLFCSVISFLVLLYVIYIRLFTSQSVIGWASVMAAVIFVGGIQLLTVGVIGSYIARIYDEVRRRPLYIVESTTGFAAGQRSEKAQTRAHFL